MEDLLAYIQSNADNAPYLIGGLLLLAGFNIPVSEDAMLFVSALLAVKRPDLLEQLFAGVFLGAFGGDLICYSVGRFLGPTLWKIKWFAKMVSEERVAKVASFYDRFGFLTLVLGRFVPFGFRNALYLTAGISKMNAMKFAVADFIAAMITCSFYFWLYHAYGETVLDYVKRANIALFGVLALVILTVIIKKRRKQPASA